jgi:hypothetical protein
MIDAFDHPEPHFSIGGASATRWRREEKPGQRGASPAASTGAGGDRPHRGRDARRRTSARQLARLALPALAAAAISACGGGSGGGGLGFQAVWEQPGTVAGQVEGCATPQPTPVPAGFGSPIPASVSLIQITIEAADGTTCCNRFAKAAERRSVYFENLTAGAAQVTIAGFPEEQYAAALSFPECALDAAAPNPPSRSCAGGRDGEPNPSFASAPQAVDVPSAGSSNAGDIQIPAQPFVLLGTCDPDTPLIVPSPGGVTSGTIDFTVADAGGGVETVEAAILQGSQTFPLELDQRPCDDAGADPDVRPCSCEGALGVRGIRSEGSAASALEPGEARLRIESVGCDGQQAVFEYPFTYSPADTPTPTDTPTATPTDTPTPAVQLRIAGGTARLGGKLDLSVSLDAAPGLVVAALEQTIGFTPTAMFLEDCAPVEALADHEVDTGREPMGCEFDCDRRFMTIFPLDGEPLPSGVVYTCPIQITAAAEPGTYALTCVATTVTDFENTPLPVVCTPGEVRVLSP